MRVTRAGTGTHRTRTLAHGRLRRARSAGSGGVGTRRSGARHGTTVRRPDRRSRPEQNTPQVPVHRRGRHLPHGGWVHRSGPGIAAAMVAVVALVVLGVLLVMGGVAATVL